MNALWVEYSLIFTMPSLEETCAKMIRDLRQCAQSPSRRAARVAVPYWAAVFLLAVGAYLHAVLKANIRSNEASNVATLLVLSAPFLAGFTLLGLCEYRDDPERTAHEFEMFLLTSTHLSAADRAHQMRILFKKYKDAMT
jgi:hypothetical protein